MNTQDTEEKTIQKKWVQDDTFSPRCVVESKTNRRVATVRATSERELDRRARLIATAGTAAQEAKELGYDPVKAVEALPELLQAAQRVVDDARLKDPDPSGPDPKPPSRDLLVELEEVLANAKGDSKYVS